MDDDDPPYIKLHCSWCGHYCTQTIEVRNAMVRSVYTCENCKEYVAHQCVAHTAYSHAFCKACVSRNIFEIAGLCGGGLG
jgi:hypothetical protein